MFELPKFMKDFFRPAKKGEVDIVEEIECQLRAGNTVIFPDIAKDSILPSIEPMIEGTVPAPLDFIPPVVDHEHPAPDLAALARKHGLESYAKVLEEKITTAQAAMDGKDYAKITQMAEDEKPIIIGNPTMPVLDTNSPTWQWIVLWAREELDKSRKLNDSIIRTDKDTAVLRGEIKRLKEILALPEKLAGK